MITNNVSLRLLNLTLFFALINLYVELNGIKGVERNLSKVPSQTSWEDKIFGYQLFFFHKVSNLFDLECQHLMRKL